MTYHNLLDKLREHDRLWGELRQKRNPFDEEQGVEAIPPPEGQETPQSIYEKYGLQLQETLQGMQSPEYLSPEWFAKRGQGGVKTTAMTEEQIGEAGGEAIGRQFQPTVPLEEYNVNLRSKFRKTIDQMSADYEQYKQDFGDKAMRQEDWAEYQKGKYWSPEDEQAFANFYEIFAPTNADIAIFGAPLLKMGVKAGVAGARAGIKAGARELAPLAREVLAGEAGFVSKGIPKEIPPVGKIVPEGKLPTPGEVPPKVVTPEVTKVTEKVTPIISETPKVEAPKISVGGEPPIPPKSVVPATPVIKEGKLWLPEPPRTTAEYMPFARKEMAGSFRKKQGVFETVEEAHQQVLKARDMGDNVVPYVQSYIHQVGKVADEFGIDTLGVATKVGNPEGLSLAINDVLSNYTHYTLTPKQLELAKREGFVYKEALKLAKSYGVEINELPGVDEAWQYIARRVKGKLNPLTGEYELPPVPTGGFKMGAKISAQKERIFDEMFEGVGKGFLYENPDQVMAYHIKGIYRLIGNKQAENLVKPLTRAVTKKAPLQFGERVIGEPALQGRAAATEVANAIDKIYAIENVPKALRVAADISGAMVGQVAAADISAPFIQGLPILGHDLKMGLKGKPSAIWAKSYGNMWKTMWNPESINKFRTSSHDLYKRALEAGVATGQSEFVSGVGTVENLLGKIPKAGGGLKEGYRQVWGRMGQAYSDFLEIARIKLFEQMETAWVRQGGNIYDLGAVINRMSGTISPSARGVGAIRRTTERIAAFAPNYLRASVLLIKDLIGRGAKAKEVQSTLAALLGVGATVYYAEEKLRGEEPKMKPWAKKWGGDGADAFTIGIGDSRVGLGSWMYGMIKTVADVSAMAVDDPDALVKWNDQHPIVKFAKSKRGASVGLVSELATGRNFFGQPFKSPKDYLMRMVESVAPISSQSMLTQEPKGGIEQVGAELMGMRAYPTPAKRVAKVVNESIPKLGQPDTEALNKKLEKATTPEMKAYIQKQGNIFTTSDLGMAIDDATYYLVPADMPADKYPAIARARVKATPLMKKFYDDIPPDKREAYRAKNPELDAMLFFWGKVEETKTGQAMNIVRQMMSDYGVPASAIPGLAKKSTSTILPSLGGMGKSTMPSPLSQYRLNKTTMPSPLRGFTR